jgi:histone H3/H4
VTPESQSKLKELAEQAKRKTAPPKDVPSTAVLPKDKTPRPPKISSS